MDRLRVLAAGEIDPESEVARLRARTGEDQIAETGKPRHRLRLAAIGSCRTAPVRQSRASSAPPPRWRQSAAGNNAGGDGEHVLGGAADLDAAHVGGVVRTKARRADRLREFAGKLVVIRCGSVPPSAGRAPRRRQSSVRTKSPASRQARIRR